MLPAIELLAAEVDTPHLKIKATLADDFTAEVEAAWSRAGIHPGSGFTVERIGGQVRAKNIRQRPDGSVVEIMFDGQAWPTAPTLGDILEWHWLAAHELTHPILDRLRLASGAMAGIAVPSVTPEECARSIARCAVDEYTCDMVADGILKTAVRVEVDGVQQGPFGLNDITGGGYGHAVHERLDSVHPGWPNIVDDYRHWRIDLDTMWTTIVTETDQTMTLLAHAEAEAASAGEHVLLERGDLASHPGVALYLAPAWHQIIDASAVPLIPNLQEFAEVDRRISDAGGRALLSLWRTLGLTAENHGARQFILRVDEPAR